jgi:hypothetical protein
MSPRLAATTLLVVIAAAAPAAAQDVVGVPALPVPQLEIGDGARAAGATIQRGDRSVGTIEAERVGERITVTATFSRKPPGRRASLCVTVAGERRCVRRKARRGLKLTMDRTAALTSALRATARSGDAQGSVSL